MLNLYGFTKKQLEEKMISLNQKPFRATQMFEWIYKKNVLSFDEMTNMGNDNVKLIKEIFTLDHLKIQKEQISQDGTRKYLFKLDDDNCIETVLMNYEYGQSVCISTQVGCNMGCAFCASGMHKKIRNLEVYEMVLQVLMVQEQLQNEEDENKRRISHVVIMGIGEPFDNYDNVMNFIQIINDPKGLEIGARHITLSTCGIVPKILEFAHFPLQINLAISLHFPTDELRNKYMPINRRYPLDVLLSSIKSYYKETSRRITFEYILLDQINDSITCAKQLIELIKGINCYVNLIPMNESNGLFKRSSRSKIFFDYLHQNNINCTLRREQGHDIDAACGQLRIKEMQKK